MCVCVVMFENGVLRRVFGSKRDDITGELRKLHNVGPGLVSSRKVPGSILGVAGGFSMPSGSSMCPRVDSASKNVYQVNPGGKGGLWVRLTTYQFQSVGLNLLEPCGPVQACNGTAFT